MGFSLFVISSLLMIEHLGNSQFLKVPEACRGFTCENNGTLRTEGNKCSCSCPGSHTGLQCETELRNSEWPDGPYATPMPIYGCPEGEDMGWKIGYINMTFSRKARDIEAVSKTRLTLLGPYSDRMIQMNFCIKPSTLRTSNSATWPSGNYKVYKVGPICPQGFEEQELVLRVPPLLQVSTDGYLPDMQIQRGNSSTTLRIQVCEKLNQEPFNVSESPWQFPFVLLPGSNLQRHGISCPTFTNINVLPETLELMSSSYESKHETRTSPKGFSYCLYRKNIKKADDCIEEEDVISFYKYNSYRFAKIRRVATSKAYEELYRDFPITTATRKNFFDAVRTDRCHSKRQNMHCARIPLEVFLESPGDPWILVDLEQTLDISFIQMGRVMFASYHAGRSERETYEGIPDVGVSLARWAFLHNGAMSCDNNIKVGDPMRTLFHRCSRPIRGRYVSLYGNGYTSAPRKVASFFLRLAQFEVSGTGRGCGKDLGLRDYGIDDYQVSASSSTKENPPDKARPNQAGWCALASDMDPFLQVDLLVATPVEGIKIYNWAKQVEIYRDHVYSVKTVPMGVESFWLEYGFDIHALNSYKASQGIKRFWVDPSLPYNHEQTFLLLNPVVASLLRVRPSAFRSTNPCLRFELVGCRRIRLKRLHCGNRDISFWTRRPKLFVPLDRQVGTLQVVNVTYRDCDVFCNSCTALTYNLETHTCSFYRTLNTSESTNVIEVTKTEHTIHYQRVCLADPTALSPVELQANFNISEHNNMRTFTTLLKFYTSDVRAFDSVYPQGSIVFKAEGVLISHGYPFHYDTGVISIWKLKVKPQYLQLTFTNISLNVYQSPTDWYTDKVIEDRIVVDPSVLDTVEYGCDEHLPATLQGVLNNSMNGRQVIFRRFAVTLEVVFCATLRESKLLVRGSGFRAVVNTTGMACSDSECHEAGRSVYGMSTNYIDTWDGLGSKVEYSIGDVKTIASLNLTVTYLVSTCDEGNGLQIMDGTLEAHTFCNLHRPLTPILTKRGEIKIRFNFERTNAVTLQGFRAVVLSYRPTKSRRSSWVAEFFLDPQLLTLWESLALYHHGRRLYAIKFMGSKSGNDKLLSANQANRICSEKMGQTATLASIWRRGDVHKVYNEIFIPTAPNAQLKKVVRASLYDYVYIGLTWVSDKQGKLTAQWMDGSPVTYTAWLPGQPSGQGVKRCTRMATYSQHLLDTWETVDCDERAAYYYFCSWDTGHSENDTLENLHKYQPSGEARMTVQSDKYFECQSEDVVSRLFLCDGVKDCLDGSDELHCKSNGMSNKLQTSELFVCESGGRIPFSMTCDFVPDCEDESDEKCVFPPCSSDEFPCNNGQCVPGDYECNYRVDCWDGSDETDCKLCQNDTFRCSDGQCIPLTQQCDGFFDCNNGLDEANCEESSRKSCADWWNHGSTNTDEFFVNSTRVLCKFDLAVSEGIVETSYFDLQAQRNAKGQFLITYGDIGFVSELMNQFDCKQSLIQTCNPHEQTIDEAEFLSSDRRLRHCLCLRLIWTANTTQLETCSDVKEYNVTEQWLLDKANVLKQHTTRPVTIVEPVMSAVDTQWMDVEPIICQERVNAEPDMLKCVKGNSAHKINRCLYELDAFGEVKGCRDLTHLQNCEHFTCPDGFAKCPSSFCISNTLLCDGQRQCREGQDEVNCWCGPQNNSVIIMFDKAEQQLHNSALRLAGQLHDQTNSRMASNVGLLKYSRDTGNQFEESSRWPSQMKLEYTTFLPGKQIQYSEITRFSQTPDEEPIPRIMNSSEMMRPDAVIVLENRESRGRLSESNLMIFNQSLERPVELFVVYVGRESGVYDIANTTEFPPNTTFVHFMSEHVVTPFSFGSLYCPDPSQEMSPVCPGKYRCHASRQCVASKNLCDGIRHCPLGDDEKLCDFVCPFNCSCFGYEADCSSFRATNESFSELSSKTRYLDLHSNDLQNFALRANSLPVLLALNMSHCSLICIPAVFLKSMHNLIILDLSYNQIEYLKAEDLKLKHRINSLDLTGNYELAVIQPNAFCDLVSLRSIVIKRSKISELAAKTFYNLTLSLLDLSENQISTVHDNVFDGATVKDLDLTKNPITTVHSGMFTGVSGMKSLRTDAYRFCCMRPNSVFEKDCYPSKDEFSSCKDLIRKEVLRFFLWVIGILSLIGNIFCLCYRFKFERKAMNSSFGIFVTNLAISDLLLSFYLLTIAIADATFRNHYILVDDWWRKSGWCGFAGVLSTLSCEGSALFILLITIDRYIVIKYPFGKFRITTKLAYIAVALTWAIVVTVATVPLAVNGYFHGQFYSQSAVCLALPLTRKRPPGWAYSVTVFIGFNFLVFVLIAVGQLLIYRGIRDSFRQMKNMTSRKTDPSAAHRLLLVATTNFLCWTPIGLTGFMAMNGHVVSSEAYTWIVVFVLPINSALNPLLYTFSAIARKKAQLSQEEHPVQMGVYSKDLLDEILFLWNSDILGQKMGYKEQYRSLAGHLSEHSLTPVEILKVALRITKAIVKLQDLELIAVDLSPEFVHIKLQNEVVRDAYLKVTPKLLSRQTEKTRDVEGIGQILSTLLTRLKRRD